ncbi:hypothetical protein [Microcoleus sp. PH2017_36_ELK_O_B]|uniref:hypothetical protein n=1 Tax=Microcoleus sp. PH2017_36_ELK_O_B TaxID=2798846 RepID=UPI0025DA4083|nr:hypothetical protein [Microcoleus sp. PH2017_36_ELK_O_B]
MSQISHPVFRVGFARSQFNVTHLLGFSAVNLLFCPANLTAFLRSVVGNLRIPLLSSLLYYALFS